MEKPEYCPNTIYDMMRRTWETEPTNRPSFPDLLDELGDLLEEGEKDHYLDLTKRFDATTVGTDQCNAVENRDYLGMMSPPDFTTQTSVTPCQPVNEDGYLEPNKCSFSFDKDDYLMPNGDGQSIEMTSFNSKQNGNAIQSIALL